MSATEVIVTERELQVLAAVVVEGRHKSAAYRLGISEQTVKNHLSQLYGKLDVGSPSEAAFRLGWITIPPEHATLRTGTCGWLGVCGRNADHRGQHGGFRPAAAVASVNGLAIDDEGTLDDRAEIKPSHGPTQADLEGRP